MRIFFILLFLVSTFIGANDKPKNIIIFIGDGMGINYVSASMIKFKDSPFYKFPDIGLSLTSALDRLITDSGAGGTAIATGEKTNYRAISVLPDSTVLPNILEIAKKNDYKTGVVVTCHLTDATPAVFLSHHIDRRKSFELSHQMVYSNVDVVIGGGLDYFKPDFMGGKRTDSLNLLDTLQNLGYGVFTTYDSLAKFADKDRLFCPLNHNGTYASKRNFSLTDLLKIALPRLENEDGFVLMVEGSLIDWVAHNHDSENVLSELKDFQDAINYAIEFTKEDDETLILVTADHETGGMSITGGLNPDGSDMVMSYATKGHSGEMVGVFAKGPGSHHFRGIYQNSEIGKKLINLIRD